MIRVRMHETRVLYSCGHEAYTILYGNGDQQEEKRQWCAETGLCPNCYAEKLKNDRDALFAMRKEQYFLPDLEGSEKQVEWAEKIRNAGIDLLERGNEKCVAQVLAGYSKEIVGKSYEETRRCITMFADVKKASFYIDNREDMYSYQWLLRMCKNYETNIEMDDPQLAEEVKREATMMPQNPTHGDAAKVILEPHCVRASYYKKDNDFRTVVKKLHFTWDVESREWKRKCTQFTGDAQERAAELINALLRAGFAVICSDTEVRRRAEEADFSPEFRRWIKKSSDEGYVIRWDRDDKDFYKDAMALPGARYRCEEHGVVVPTIHWREIMDFAYIQGFKLSPKAQAIADTARDAEIPADPAEPTKQSIPDGQNKLAEILQSGTEVLEDLID